MAPAAATDEEKAKKAAEKARRKAEFEAKRAKEGNPPKKKQLSKAERRELQEKQRADKEAKKNPKPKADKPPPPPVERPTTILGHLTKATSSTPPADGVPASIVELGQKYAAGEFDGSNDRCRSLLDAVRTSIKDYAPPPDAAAARDLDVKLKSWASYLEKCREPTASTLAALKRLRLVASTLPPDISPSEAQAAVETCCDRFREERVELAVREIGRRGAQKIRDGDVVVAYGYADAVEALFSEAVGRNFEVVVVDSAPAFAGRRLLNALYAKRVRTTYVRLTAAAPEIERATLVVLGADAVFSNGSILARSGAFAVAALAQRRHVPVLVTCEAYKCHDRVRLDAADANELFEFPSSDDTPPLTHLTYDVTPASYVSAVATEHGLLPPSAVAALIRELAEKETA
ncbi:unnamed protein product [Pelagomonas calceolata]|uniref:Translation initiation factor eIF2B subunit delta n=1 Tax=Pelagomonas calceolata TaxID=35677 RepID=A0A8J2S709_9STRA|nr:unnamed protein product [Pelagomonas calceolata]